LKRRDDIAEPRQADARDLFEFVVTFTCDTTKLDAETLAKMDRAPIRRLLDVLSERAKKMDPMDQGDQRKKQFEEETNRIFEVWKNNRANMDNFWKKFFGFGLLDAGGNFLEKVVSKAVDATPAATGALFGLALQGPLLASGLGIGIGLFTHTAKTYAEWRHKDRDSPYHYLTLMEKAGVVIRADLRV
jgi:hypothetical protein